MRSEGDSGNSIVMVFVRIGGTWCRVSIPSGCIGNWIVHRKIYKNKMPSIPAVRPTPVKHSLESALEKSSNHFFCPGGHAPTREHHVNYTVSHLGLGHSRPPWRREQHHTE